MRTTLNIDDDVLFALNDEGHIHHLTASRWLAQHMHLGWASCPLTQNGMLRIMSQASYKNVQGLSVLFEKLRNETSQPYHVFWPNDFSLLHQAFIDADKLLSPRQLTDAYLLAPAVKHGGRLITLDKRIPLNSVKGAKAMHWVSL